MKLEKLSEENQQMLPGKPGILPCHAGRKGGIISYNWGDFYDFRNEIYLLAIL